jgi:hypothetical protein
MYIWYREESLLVLNLGRVIAQADSRRLPIAAARVQTWVWSCGAGAGFLRELLFPLLIYIPSASP